MPTGEYLQYGGQAVIEGVMMRSPRFFAVACRAPNDEIVLQAEALAITWIGRQKWLKKPFLRGSLALVDAMMLGIRALTFASNIQLDERYAKTPPTDAVADPAPESAATAEKPTPSSSIQGIAIGGAMVVGLGFGVVLFFVVPTLISEFFKRYGWSVGALNMLDGVLRILIFLGYIMLIGLNKEIRRVFQYHGAEHKAINTLEDGQEMSLENARAQTRLHPRCGTSFVIIVLLLSILVFSVLPRPVVYLRIPMHLLMLPVIAGIAYEAIRLAGRFRSSFWTKIAFAPGLLTQYLTTREPDDRQIEVALAALNSVIEREGFDHERVVV